MINIEEFKLYKYPADTEKGLIYYSFWFFVLLFIVYKFLNEFFLILYIIWSIFFLIFLIWWLHKRIRYNYWFNRFYVIFAVTIDYEDKELYKTYKELISNFEEQLKDYHLTKKIKVRMKPVDIKFSDHSAAEAKTKFNTLCSTLVISGLPIKTGGETKFKFNFHYEFLYHDKKSKEDYYKKIFNKKISKSITGKSWGTKRGSVSSKSALYGNTFTVSTYILSLCAGSMGSLDKSIELLKPSRDECNKNINKKEYGPLIADLRDYLFKIYKAKFSSSYWSLNIDELKPIAQEMERLDKYNYNTYMVMAVVSELENNREKAKEYTQQAENNHPKNIFDFMFNYLYFYLTEDNYSEALKVLKEMEKSINKRDPKEIINFLYNQYEISEDPALLFNIGVVIFIWGEEELGKVELNKFIKKVKKDDKYKILVDASEELLKKYK